MECVDEDVDVGYDYWIGVFLSVFYRVLWLLMLMRNCDVCGLLKVGRGLMVVVGWCFVRCFCRVFLMKFVKV